jgi:hypothetical protein
MMIFPVNMNIAHPDYPSHVNEYIQSKIRKPVNAELLALETEKARAAFEKEYRRWITGRKEELF